MFIYVFIMNWLLPTYILLFPSFLKNLGLYKYLAQCLTIYIYIFLYCYCLWYQKSTLQKWDLLKVKLENIFFFWTRISLLSPSFSRNSVIRPGWPYWVLILNVCIITLGWKLFKISKFKCSSIMCHHSRIRSWSLHGFQWNFSPWVVYPLL